MLAFWRERDIFARSLAGARRPPSPSSSTRARRRPTGARARTTCSRASSRTSSRASRPCAGASWTGAAAGTATACRSSSRWRSASGISGKPEIEAYGIAEFNALCRESVLTYLDEWERLTERIGFWIDTDRAYRTMDTDYIESVWWSLARAVRPRPALPQRQGRPVLPALRHRALEPRGGPGLPGRRRPVGLRALPPGGRRRVAAGVDHDALDAAGQPGGRDPPRGHLRRGRARRRDPDPGRAAGRRRVLGEGARPVAPHPGHRAARARVRRRPSASSRAPTGWSTPTSSRPSDGTGIVHIAPAFGEDDMATARRHGLDAPNPVGPDGRFTDAVGPWAGPPGEGGRPGPDRRPRRARPAAALRDPPPRLPALLALRHAAPLLRQAVLVHPHHRRARPHAGAERGDRLAPRAGARRALRQVARGQRRLGDLARPLLGHAAAAVALPRLRPGRGRRLVRRAARALHDAARPDFDPHRPFVDEVALTCSCGGRDAPRARGRGRLVRQRRDALRPGAPPVLHGRRPDRAGAGRLHLRGPRPDARLVLLAAGREHAPLRRDGLPQRGLPRADPRRRGPEDEQEQGQRDRALDRPRPPGRRRLPLVPAHGPEPLGLVPLQPRGGRRRDAALPADALEHALVPRHLRLAAGRLGARAAPPPTPPRCARWTAGSCRASTARRRR